MPLSSVLRADGARLSSSVPLQSLLILELALAASSLRAQDAPTTPALPTPPTMPTADAALDAVTVDGARQPYRTLVVTGAMKTDTPARDLPQSVRVLSGALLADAGVTRLDQALDLASGIARQSNLGGLWDSYAMRGFTGDPSGPGVHRRRSVQRAGTCGGQGDVAAIQGAARGRRLLPRPRRGDQAPGAGGIDLRAGPVVRA